MTRKFFNFYFDKRYEGEIKENIEKYGKICSWFINMYAVSLKIDFMAYGLHRDQPPALELRLYIVIPDISIDVARRWSFSGFCGNFLSKFSDSRTGACELRSSSFSRLARIRAIRSIPEEFKDDILKKVNNKTENGTRNFGKNYLYDLNLKFQSRN